MELFEYHFSNLSGNLYHDEQNNTYEMFSNIGKPMHLNYLTFRELFVQMNERKDLNILESGISSAGTSSTYLFNEYIKKYGGRFWSVDINQDLIDMCQGNMCPGTTLICNDSIKFFSEFCIKNKELKADVIYLDSLDLDWYNPDPAAIHGLNEYLSLLPTYKKNTLLLIDDTPCNPYWMDSRDSIYNDMIEYYKKNNNLPGKGQYILDVYKNADILLHNYQILYKFN
jgi:hypothetical protein